MSNGYADINEIYVHDIDLFLYGIGSSGKMILHKVGNIFSLVG